MTINAHGKIYTLGTSNRKIEEFLDILKFYKIDCVIDIRRFPTSRWEHFKKENLEKALKEENIAYFYLGKELGGYRKGGYEKYTEKEFFKKGIEKLEKIAIKRVCVFICAERLPWKCHRRFVGKALQQRGWKVIHIIDLKKEWEDLTLLFQDNI